MCSELLEGGIFHEVHGTAEIAVESHVSKLNLDPGCMQAQLVLVMLSAQSSTV